MIKHIRYVFAVILSCFYLCSAFSQNECESFMDNYQALKPQCDSANSDFNIIKGKNTCAGDSTVLENLSYASPSGNISKIYVDWGDGTCETFVGNPSTLRHLYKINKDTCLQGKEFIRIPISLGSYIECSQGKSEDLKTGYVFIYFKPQVNFAIEGKRCIGEPLLFRNLSCENGKNIKYTWYIDGDSVSNVKNLPYTFKDTLIHTIRLKVENEHCGSNTSIQTIKILPKPKASLQVISGVILPDTVCLTNPRVWLHGLKSQGNNSYQWEVKRGPGGSTAGWNFITRKDSTTVGIEFKAKGDYLIELTVNNDCNEPSKALFNVHVLSVPDVPIPVISDNCAPFALKLDWPNLKDAKVTLNGVKLTRDTLLGKGSYLLKAFAYSPCGSVTVTRNFTINDKTKPEIAVASDSVCTGTRLLLKSQPTASQWFVNGVKQSDSSYVFNQSGRYQVIAVTSPGTSCESRDSIMITVVPIRTLSLAPQADQCTPFVYRIPDKKNYATYYLNGQVLTADQVDLPVGQHVVRAVYKDFCSDFDLSDTIVIRKKENLAILTPLDKDTLCVNTNVQLNANLSGVIWRGPGIDTSTGVFHPLTGGTYFVQVIYAEGTTCEVRDTAQVFVLNSPQINIPDALVECSPFIYPLPIRVPGATYSINGLPLLPDFPLGPGSYTVEVNYKDLCVQYQLRDSFTVVDKPAFQLVAIPDKDTICLGNQMVLKGNISALQWSGSGIVNTTADSLTVLVNQTGIIRFFAIALANSSCEQRDTLQFYVQDLKIDIEDQSFCQGATAVPLNAMPATGSFAINGCAACIQGNQFLPSNYSGIYPVQVSYFVDDGVCQSVENIELNRIEPGAGFTLDTLLCAGSSFSVNTAQSQADFLQWKINGISVSELPENQGFQEGSYQLELVAVIGACRDSITLQIDVITPPPVLEVDLAPLSGCTPLYTIASAQDTLYKNTSYTWQYQYQGIGRSKGLVLQDTFQWVNTSQEIELIPLVLKAKNICGEWSTSDTVKVLPLPLAELGIDSSSTGCSPYHVIITNRATGYPDSCLLSINGVLETASCFDTLQRTFFATDSTETVALSLKAINQCGENTWLDTIQVVPAFVDAYFELDKYTICPNDTIVFKDATTPKPLLVSWDFGDGGRKNGSLAKHSYTFGDTTLYVIMRVSNGCGYDSLLRKLNLLPEPDLSFVLPPFACQGDEVSILNTSPDNYFSYLWDFGDGATLVAYQPTHSFKAPGLSSDVTLKVTDWNLCTNTLTKPLQIQPAPELAYSLSSDKACIGKPIQLTSESKYVDQIEWFINGMKQSSATSIEFLPADNWYDIKLVGTYKQRCKDSLLTVAALKGVRCDIAAPLALSLRAENVNNNFFTIYSVDNSIETILELDVFSRWGELVFSKQGFPPNQPAQGWNGLLNGSRANGGVYVWRAIVRYFDGSTATLTGDLTVLE